MRSGPATVAVAGGDGSLRGAADRIAGSEVALLPIPAGTMNHFARRLGHETPEVAVEALKTGRVERAPVGIVDHHVFLNTATFGHYAAVIRRRERWRRYLTKWPAAGLAFAVTVARMRDLEFEVEIDGRALRKTGPLLWVGVGRGTFPRVHRSDEHPGPTQLEIVIPRPRGRIASIAFLARLALRLVSNRQPSPDRDVDILHARSLLIRGPARIESTLDGEVLEVHPPVFVGVEDGCLRVVVPGLAPDCAR